MHRSILIFFLPWKGINIVSRLAGKIVYPTRNSNIDSAFFRIHNLLKYMIPAGVQV